MTKELVTLKLSEIVFDETIYPRKEHNPAKVKEYVDSIEAIEAAGNYIELSANKKLLDGKHRWLAYRKINDGTDQDIKAYIWTDITAEKDEFVKAIELNSSHGQQLTANDKDQNCRVLYQKYGFSLETICEIVKVSKTRASEALKPIRDEERRKQDETIFSMHLAAYTQEEIAAAVGVTHPTISGRLKDLVNKVPAYFSYKVFEQDTDFVPPLFNVWRFSKLSNNVAHFGNSEQSIVDNLLYLYTQPYDIVFDPFAGGGSTIDICKRRLRRYWVSDRKPIVERENEIRLLDVAKGLPDFNGRWNDVTLTYLDPPYWKQAEGQYSTDADDLANMPLDQFTDTLTGIVNRIAEKQKRGHIALLIQPTQWKSDGREFTDHVFDIVSRVNPMLLKLKNRVSCPYSSEQYNAQQVNWAKENKELLVISRELIIWKRL